MTSVTDPQGILVGIYTDGDVRRTISLELEPEKHSNSTSYEPKIIKKYCLICWLMTLDVDGKSQNYLGFSCR